MIWFFNKACTPEKRPTKKLFEFRYPWIFFLDYFIGNAKDLQYLVDIDVVKSILKEGHFKRVPLQMYFVSHTPRILER
jgi:hypothetical protein